MKRMIILKKSQSNFQVYTSLNSITLILILYKYIFCIELLLWLVDPLPLIIDY